MFKRIILEDWQSVVPYLCFALIGGAFLIIVVRALCLKKSDVDHLAHLPLLDDEELKRADQDS